MSTRRLPDRPNLSQLRKQARDFQRAVRTGEPDALQTAGLTVAEPDYPLHRAQRALARGYGFAGWPRLAQHVAAIEQRSWVSSTAPADEPAPDRILRLACLTWDGRALDQRAAESLLDAAVIRTSVALAAVTARPDCSRSCWPRTPARPPGPSARTAGRR